MIATKDRVVSLSYDLRIDAPDGKIVETVTAETPLTFVFGTGRLLPKFEANIQGLKEGDPFDFSILSKDAYGEFNQDALVNVPIHIFQVNGKLDENLVTIGNQIPMMDKAGNRLTGKVLEVTKESVRMDFNHPLAGNDLYFKGMVTAIREATEEELNPDHNNCSGCNCSSNCEDGECS